MLQPGENNIDSRRVTGNQKDGYRLQWTVCLNDGRLIKKSTMLKNATMGQVRARAREQAAELLAHSGIRPEWSGSSLISDYIQEVSIEAVKASPQLRQTSKDAHVHKLELLSAALKGYCVADAAKPKTLLEKLNYIAQKHGTATAKQCRKVANKWLMQRLVIDGVLTHNPLREATLEITVEHVARQKPKGGVALTSQERSRAIDWMLALDPADPEKTTPKRGHYTQEEVARKRQGIVDMALLQAATGLRIGECRNLAPQDIKRGENGSVLVHVTPETSKTKKGRDIQVLDDRIAARILRRAEDMERKGQGWLFPSPVSGTQWDRSNCQKAMTAFVHEVGSECDVPEMTTHGSHIWRASISTLLAEKGVSPEARAAYLGHDIPVNRQFYTASVDTSIVYETLRSN